jgi:hypothetical protein
LHPGCQSRFVEFRALEALFDWLKASFNQLAEAGFQIGSSPEKQMTGNGPPALCINPVHWLD